MNILPQDGNHVTYLCRFCLLAGLAFLSACTTTDIDQFRQSATTINGDESIVILGRRQSNNYETESDFVQCVAGVVGSGRNSIKVIPEREFLDAMFPFFEPRTAPMRTSHLQQVVDQDVAAEKLEEYGIQYIVWVDGTTRRSGQSGSISCAIGPGGGGCFGFGTWTDDSNFEAEVWDVETLQSVGSISTDANGQSYMPAVVIPIPLIARVEANACNALGNQLKQFINGGE
ncbi:MAG: hypothetical protein RQ899_11105 [Pseudomonadales bacterium]|nr:hypothetical protein [Pseudomonadales bacterium]